MRKTLRLTVEEAETLAERSKRAALTEAAYFRFLISNKPNDYPEIRIMLKKLINEINHIGVNINQIVHNHNSGLYSETDKERLIAYMRRLNQTVDRAVDEIGNQ